MRSTVMSTMALAAAMLLSISSVAETTLAQDKPAENKLPWTAEEIRKSWGKGTSYMFDLKTEDDGAGTIIIDVWNVTEKGFTTRSGMAEKGKFLKFKDDEERTWEKHHADFTRMTEGGTLSEEQVETPYSTFDCTCYTTVQEEENGKWTSKVWLSKELPGIFVKIERTGEMKDRKDFEQWTLAGIGMPQADRPWSDEKIAEAWKDGAKMVFSASQGEMKATITLNITKAGPDGVTYSSTELVNGEERQDAEKTESWYKFFASVMPPRFDTTKADEKIKVAGGEFECVKYTHSSKSEDGNSGLTTWCCKDKPGLLVKIVQNFSWGEETMEMVLELTEYKVGK